MSRFAPSLTVPLWRRLGLVFIVGMAAILAVFVCVSALLLSQSWTNSRTAAEITLERGAEIIDSTVNRQLLQVDGALASLPALLNAVAPTGEVSSDQAARLLRSLNFSTFTFRDLLLVRPDGTVWASGRPRFKSRAVPTGATETTPGSVSIIGPLLDSVSGQSNLYLARSIDIPGQGSLRAMAEIPLPLLATLLSEAGQLSGTRMVLQRSDGRLLASIPPDAPLAPAVQEAINGSRPNDGKVFEVPIPGSATAILAVMRHTLYSGIEVVLTLDEDVAMAQWIRDRNRLLAGIALAALLSAGVAGALHVAVQQHDRLEAERDDMRSVLENAVEAMADGFVMWDRDDRLVTCNSRYRELYSRIAPLMVPGISYEAVVRQGVLRGQYPEATDVEPFVRQTMDWHRRAQGPLERQLPDGRSLLITDTRTTDGGIVGIRTDVSELKQALTDLARVNRVATAAMTEVRAKNAALEERESALLIQNERFDAALNNMSQGLLMVDAFQRLIVCNQQFNDLFDLPASASLPGVSMDALFASARQLGCWDTVTVDRLRETQETLAAEAQSSRFIVSDLDGRAVAVHQRPMKDGGWVATYEDITKQHSAESRIRFLAHHDELTGLPNRSMLRQWIEDMQPAFRRGGRTLALLYLDLDKFKNINDTLGHSSGDALLSSVATRLRGSLTDGQIAARLGGDEFAVAGLFGDVPGDASALASRLLDTLSEPYMIGSHRMSIGVSIGIAVTDSEGLASDTLFKNADMALYEAKGRGRGIHCMFEPAMEQRLRSRLSLEDDLRLALKEEQFELAYQPIFDLVADRVVGFEALLRWPHVERGFVSPAVFIPLAEDLGLISELGAWVLNRACHDAVQFPLAPKMAVNLSPAQLRTDGISEMIHAALQSSGLDPRRLELEITETVLLEDNDRTLGLLRDLRETGVRLVLDDFGTGYSSLSHLRNLPLDKIKIDQTFIRELTTRSDSAAIVTAVADLAGRLGMITTAEGVETADQLELVRRIGCTEAQGYLLGRPCPLLKAITYLAEPAPPEPVLLSLTA